jgi:hypothetical protein
MMEGLRRCAFAALGAALLSGCAVPPPAYTPQGIVVALKNAGMEDDWPAGYPCVPGWICLMHSDATAYRFAPDEAKPAKGKRSACVTRVKDEPWASTIQAVLDRTLGGKRLRFSIDVRLQGVTGKGAGAWVALKDSRGAPLHTEENLAGASPGCSRGHGADGARRDLLRRRRPRNPAAAQKPCIIKPVLTQGLESTGRRSTHTI